MGLSSFAGSSQKRWSAPKSLWSRLDGHGLLWGGVGLGWDGCGVEACGAVARVTARPQLYSVSKDEKGAACEYTLYLRDCAVLLAYSHRSQDLAAQAKTINMPTPLDRATSQRVGDFWSWNLIYVVCILVMRTPKC